MFKLYIRQVPLEEGHGKPLQYFCLENPNGQRSLEDYMHLFVWQDEDIVKG